MADQRLTPADLDRVEAENALLGDTGELSALLVAEVRALWAERERWERETDELRKLASRLRDQLEEAREEMLTDG